MTPDMREALDQRSTLIEQRADAVLDTALDVSEPWTRDLGPQPSDPKAAAAWRGHARTVAAYRDRYTITTDRALGPEPEQTAQKIDAARARAALDRARTLTNPATTDPAPQHAASREQRRPVL
ncbi:MAG: hypothetical protein R2909_20050 [Gemmatimonadales bacterium]